MIFFEIKKHILIMSRSKTCILDDGFQLRDGFKQSKWKFKMAFAMKGGGGLECHIPILKNDFFKNHLESFPDCENVFCT